MRSGAPIQSTLVIAAAAAAMTSVNTVRDDGLCALKSDYDEPPERSPRGHGKSRMPRGNYAKQRREARKRARRQR